MPQLDRLFHELVRRNASDLHLAVGYPVKMRIHGDLEIVREKRFTPEEAQELFRELVTEQQWNRFIERHDLDFSYGVPGVVRLRGNYFCQHWGFGAVFRVIPDEITPWTELGLPKAVVDLTDRAHGLILVTGPTGSGKSTSLAALLHVINSNQNRHIITIEEPIEFLHRNDLSVVIQREVGIHTSSFAEALRAAVREDPDVILVGELRDRETMSRALVAAEMGYLVFGTLHTNGAARAINRVVDLFPAGQQEGIRIAMSTTLIAVVSQLLLRTPDGQGRHAVFEVLLNNRAIANSLREGNIGKLMSAMQTGVAKGMQTMDDALLKAVKQRKVAGVEAWRKATDKKPFERYARRV